MQNINFIVGENKERKVAFEWNLCWDNHIQELDFHRIYYMTKGHGILYLNNGTTFDILPGYLYLIPAFSVNNTKTLEEMYQFADELQSKHIENHNIKAKIRQQLQILRDKGFIEFLGNGHYRKIIK